MLSNNVQTFEVINYTITLPLRWHGSIISKILIGLCAPRLNSIKCLVSLQYEQYIVRHGLMRFVVIKGFKISFKVVWHTVCGYSGWFGVVECGLGTIAYCRTITFFSSIGHAVGHFYLGFYPGMVIT